MVEEALLFYGLHLKIMERNEKKNAFLEITIENKF